MITCRIIVTGIALFALIAGTNGCTESLPEYADPRSVFQASLQGSQILTAGRNEIDFKFILRNKFDETFQAEAKIAGYIEASLEKDRSVKIRFDLDVSDLQNSNRYDPLTRLLTVDVGDSLVFAVRWNFLDDQGRDVRRTQFDFVADPQCPYRCVARRERFVLSGELGVYDRIPPVQIPRAEFEICYISRWVNPKYCPPAFPDPPCDWQPPNVGGSTCVPDNFLPIL